MRKIIFSTVVAGALVLFAVSSLRACGSEEQVGSGPAKLAPPGNLGVAAVIQYMSICSPDIYDIPSYNPYVAANNFAAGLTTGAQNIPRAQWTVLTNHQDIAVSASDFDASSTSQRDAVLFAGHGDIGLVQFSCTNNQSYPLSQQYWGPGTATVVNRYQPNGKNLPGVVGGRLKWVFLLSSDSVSPPKQFPFDPSPDFVGDWVPAFRSSPGHPGSLHGLYGAWQSPGSCNNPALNTYPGRTCDISDLVLPGIASSLPGYIYSTVQPLIVHDAFQHAMLDNGMEFGWSEFEDANNIADTFTGGTGWNANPGANLYEFTLIVPHNVIGAPAIQLQPHTFTLEPYALNRESINDAAQQSRAQSYLNETVYSTDNGSFKEMRTNSGLVARHNYSTSGAIIISGKAFNNVLAFDEPTALNAATDYVNNTLGMPSDAQLASVGDETQCDDSSGSCIHVGYVFTWLHSSGLVAGGDAIRVVIDDDHSQHRTCEEFDPNTHRCIQWVTWYLDTPNVSYAYRLWRSQGQVVNKTLNGRSTGGQSIDEVTAASALPPNTMITGCKAGYWTTGPTGNASDGEEPVWLFQAGDYAIYAVDGFTGQVVGQLTL